MAVLGKLLKNRRAGDAGLAWNAPNLAGADTLVLTSPDFRHEATIRVVHAGRRLGGEDVSPALSWTAAPEGTAQLLLVVEDPDAPTPKPFVHGVFLIDPSVTGLAQGALDARSPAAGVRPLRSGRGRGYLGPAPIEGHGPHRYVFQLFALAKPITALPAARTWTRPSRAPCSPPPARFSRADGSTVSTRIPDQTGPVACAATFPPRPPAGSAARPPAHRPNRAAVPAAS